MKFSEIPIGKPFDWNGVTYVKTTENKACDIVGFHFNQNCEVDITKNGFLTTLVNAVNATRLDNPK